jgi:signal transduction histidine kinase
MAEREQARAPRRVRAPKLKAPTQAQVMEVAFALAKELSLDLREEELVGTFAAALRQLLPGRHICLRVVDPRTLKLTSLVADGKLAVGGEAVLDEPLAIKRSALKRTRLPDSIASSIRVDVVDSYDPLFVHSSGGFSVPLVASGELFGLLNIEYPPGANIAADEPLVIPLANQLSVALRNLHLLGETRYYRDYLRQMIDVANALILVIDRDRKIAVMNAAMQRYAGFGNEVIGTDVEAIRQKSTAPEPRLGSLLIDGLRGREHADTEVMVMNHATGDLKKALFSTSVIRAPDGSIDGVIGIGQDRERVTLLERQVIQAEKLATLGQLAAGVVHELNNPLTQISVYGEYMVRLLEKSGSGGDVDKARRVVEGAARIQKLTRDLMNYARPSGEPEIVGLNDVVRQALTFCEHVIKRAEAEVKLELADDLPRVRVIPTQFHQVLINLVTNACHALPDAGQAVTVTTRRGPDSKSLTLSVTDSGVGIDRADRAHVFEPFFTTKKEGKGTGLGLSIVKNIVERHGGSITFDSQVGQGTTFHITLPIAEGV